MTDLHGKTSSNMTKHTCVFEQEVMGSQSSRGSQSLDPEGSSCLSLGHIYVLSSHLVETQGS